MNEPNHNMGQLFAQLGLPSDQAFILGFIETHKPLDAAMRLHEAPFWSVAQADFLRDEILEDADWAEIIDALNLELRSR